MSEHFLSLWISVISRQPQNVKSWIYFNLKIIQIQIIYYLIVSCGWIVFSESDKCIIMYSRFVFTLPIRLVRFWCVCRAVEKDTIR